MVVVNGENTFFSDDMSFILSYIYLYKIGSQEKGLDNSTEPFYVDGKGWKLEECRLILVTHLTI